MSIAVKSVNETKYTDSRHHNHFNIQSSSYLANEDEDEAVDEDEKTHHHHLLLLNITIAGVKVKQ